MNDCVLWPGSIATTGYGVVRVNRRAVYAHRAIWERNRGAILPGMVICHTCDNPPCIKLDHLFLGTKKDNSRDMAAKGRAGAQVHPERRACGPANGAHTRPDRRPNGERHGLHKLSWDEVEYIRAVSPTRTMTSLANQFDVDRSTISAIVNGKTWVRP